MDTVLLYIMFNDVKQITKGMAMTIEKKAIQKAAEVLVDDHVMWNVNELITRLQEIDPDHDELYDLSFGPLDEETGEHQEVLTHVQVTETLGCWLKEKGEAVAEIYGLTVWGRTTYGQMICMDYVIEEIALEKMLVRGRDDYFIHKWAK